MEALEAEGTAGVRLELDDAALSDAAPSDGVDAADDGVAIEVEKGSETPYRRSLSSIFAHLPQLSCVCCTSSGGCHALMGAWRPQMN